MGYYKRLLQGIYTKFIVYTKNPIAKIYLILNPHERERHHRRR